MLLGQVERVIINPHNRRVTAFVAHGKFPDLDTQTNIGFPTRFPSRNAAVVVPIQAVHYETDSSVQLDVNTD